MKKAVIYTRCAGKQNTEEKLSYQSHVCYDFAKTHNIQIVGYYEDCNRSGFNFKRELFQFMLKECKPEWDFIIVESFSRFTRNLHFKAKDIKQLLDNDIKVYSAIDNMVIDLKQFIEFADLLKLKNKRSGE